MKKFLISLAILSGVPAFAHGPHNFGHRHYHPGYGWVAPALIGGAVVYGLTHQQSVIVQQPPVVVQQPPVVVQQQNCSPWVEIRNPDGSTTISRTCTQ